MISDTKSEIVDTSATPDLEVDTKKKGGRREELTSLPHEKLVEKCLALLSDLDAVRSQLRRSKKAEYAAKFKLTVKEKECNELQNERRLARWGAVTEGIERKEALMDVYIHDTLSSLSSELSFKKKEIDALTREVKMLKARKSSEFGREITEKLRLAMAENVSLKEHQKKTSALEKQIVLLQKANNTLKHNKRDADAELADRDKKIQQLEERILESSNDGESRMEGRIDDVSNTDPTEETVDHEMDEMNAEDGRVSEPTTPEFQSKVVKSSVIMQSASTIGPGDKTAEQVVANVMETAQNEEKTNA